VGAKVKNLLLIENKKNKMNEKQENEFLEKDQPILYWALKYIKYYSIIPVSKEKVPLINWQKYQHEKATEAQVKEWFDKENPPNIGIVTGKISGITVVDIESGGKWDDYPVTQTARTGGGGVHLYYRYAEGVQNKARIRELTDIRGNGGYVVAPPSAHASGKKYEWIRKELTQPFPYGKFDLTPEKNTNWDEVLKGVNQGGRNQTAAQVIGKFLATLSPEDWMTTAWGMTVIWNQTNVPPLSERELRATFNSIVGREVRSGKKLSPRNAPQSTQKNDSEEEVVDIKLMSQIAGDITDDMTVSYPTGFETIDKNFKGGLKEGDLFFVTGYSGLGKTSWMQSITYNLDKIGQPTMWFTFEVPIGELWRKFKDMGVSENFQAYAPEKIVTRNMDWVEKKIIEARDKFKTKVVFIDHLGFLALEPDNYDKNLSSNLSTILTMISRRLKTLAIKEGVAIVLAGHVRKPDNKKGDSAPTQHDIKDSSGVAQESDAVIVVHRKRQSGGENMMDDNVYEKETTIIIDKNRRTGITKSFKLNLHEGRLMDDKEYMEKGFNGL
jgi:archaellum biogenesis ATPase FlaH